MSTPCCVCARALLCSNMYGYVYVMDATNFGFNLEKYLGAFL